MCYWSVFIMMSDKFIPIRSKGGGFAETHIGSAVGLVVGRPANHRLCGGTGAVCPVAENNGWAYCRYFICVSVLFRLAAVGVGGVYRAAQARAQFFEKQQPALDWLAVDFVVCKPMAGYTGN